MKNIMNQDIKIASWSQIYVIYICQGKSLESFTTLGNLNLMQAPYHKSDPDIHKMKAVKSYSFLQWDIALIKPYTQIEYC